MESHFLVELVIFFSFFLAGISILTPLSKKFEFPYTVALLFTGFIAQSFTHWFDLESEIFLSPDVIFFILLPILLFEGALHINFHQFRLQFKTITAFSVIGLLISVAVITAGLHYMAGMPLQAALLFGAIISATDPIAVLALFKDLGGPKRLALVADGESMFNDATAVVAFRVISSFVIAGTTFSATALAQGMLSFAYIFTGSIMLGLFLGYMVSYFIQKIENEPLIEATLTVALAIGSFIFAEHYLHLSGVITTVMSALVLGHLSRTKIASPTLHFIKELWGFMGYVSVSLVFFFAAYNIDFFVFQQNLDMVGYAIAMVLLARAVSIYGTAFITNTFPLFKNEPNIPLSWQHILNWGGLRGVIPLVLVYSLPESYSYRQEMLAFTLGALLFTLIVNGLTIKSLLLMLKLNIPRDEEKIVDHELAILGAQQQLEHLAALRTGDYDARIISDFKKSIQAFEKNEREQLLRTLPSVDLVLSLRLHALAIQRTVIAELLESGYINENVYYEYEVQLDLQEDALEFPQLYSREYVDKWPDVTSSHISFRRRIAKIRSFMRDFPALKKFFKSSEDEIVFERFMLVKARIIANTEVDEYLKNCLLIMKKQRGIEKAVATVRKIYSAFQDQNNEELANLHKKYPRVVKEYQRKLLSSTLFA